MSNCKRNNKKAKKIFSRIQKFYCKHFSRSRKRFFAIINPLVRLLVFLGTLIIGGVVLLLLSFAVLKIIPLDPASDQYLSFEHAFVPIIASIVAGINTAIIIALLTSKEIFNHKEFYYFFRMGWSIFSNDFLILYSVSYLITSLLSFVSNPLSSVVHIIVSAFFSLFLFVKYIIFKNKSDQEAFIYYLKSSSKLKKLQKNRIIADFLNVYKFIDSKNANTTKSIDIIMKSEFDLYLEYAIITKIFEEDREIKNEQHAIEEHLTRKCSIIETPIQLISILCILKCYESSIINKKDSQLKKNSEKSLATLKSCYENLFVSPLMEFAQFKFDLDYLPDEIHLTEQKTKSVLKMITDIIFTQKVIYELLNNSLNEYCKLNNSYEKEHNLKTILKNILNTQRKNENDYPKVIAAQVLGNLNRKMNKSK